MFIFRIKKTDWLSLERYIYIYILPIIKIGCFQKLWPVSRPYDIVRASSLSDLLNSSDKIDASDANHQCADVEGKEREKEYGEQKQQVGTRPVDKRRLCVENKMNTCKEAPGKTK